MSQDFFSMIFHLLPEDIPHLVRWGPVQQSLYVDVEDVLAGKVGPAPTDMYFGPALHKEPDGHKESVTGACVCWVDYDGDTPATPLIPPTAVVASGGPHRAHFYWALDRVVGPGELEDLNKILMAHLRQKGNEWDAARVLRVPGTINTKYDPPKRVKLIALQPSKVYSPEVLMKVKAVPPAAIQVDPQKSRSERDYRLVRLLLHWGIPEDIVRDSLRMVSTKAREEPEHYIDQTLKSARDSKDVPIEVIVDAVQKGARTSQEKAPSRALASFYVEPVGRLRSPDGQDQGIALRVIDETGPLGEFGATQRDFDGRRAIHQWLERNNLKSLTWHGRESDALDLYRACVQACPEEVILQVKAGGRHQLGDARVFIYGPRDAITHPPDAGVPILWTPNTIPSISINLGTGPFLSETISDLMTTVLECNTPDVVLPALGWAMGVPLKPVFAEVGARYPILMVYGAKGSGKSTFLEEVLFPLLGLSDASTPNKVSALGAGVSRFALLSAMALYNAVPLWIGDFRSSLPNAEDLAQELRLGYDGHTEQRGRQDLTVSTWELCRPVVVDGEALFSDAATRDRCVPVRMIQSRVAPGSDYRKAYLKLRDLPRDLFYVFAREFLQYSLGLSPQDILNDFRESERQFAEYLPFSRAARNVAVVWTGVKVLRNFLEERKCPVPGLGAGVEPFLKSMENIYLPVLGTRTPAELFVEIVAALYFQAVPWARKFCFYDPEEDILWVQVISAHHWVGHYRRQEIPHVDMLVPILEERIGVYLIEPRQVHERGGGIYWGIDVQKCQELGLNVPRPIGPTEGPDSMGGDIPIRFDVYDDTGGDTDATVNLD